MTEMDSYRLSPGGFRPIFVRQALLSAVAIAALAFVAEWARPSRDELLPLLAGLVVGAVALGLGLLLRLQHRRWRGWRLEVSPAGGRLWHEERLRTWRPLQRARWRSAARARRDGRLDQASRKRVDGTTFSVVLLVAVKLAQVLGG